MNTPHEDKLDDQTFAQQATPMTITPEALKRREQIARIIDPSSWRVFDEQLRLVKRIPNAGYDPDNFKDRKSLAIADAILATLEATQAENVRLAQFQVMLTTLRADEGDSVTLLCDNPDFNGQPSNAIECNGSWTDWEDRRFTGDSLHAAVAAAHAARQALSTSGEGS